METSGPEAVREWRELLRQVPPEAEPTSYLATQLARDFEDAGHSYDEAFEAAQAVFRDMQHAAWVHSERTRRRLELRREERQRRWRWAREELLNQGEPADDRSVGEKLGYSEPDRAMRQWRLDGDI
jgi:hypothetical protein